jgi:tRNA(Ile)-lysidine synthase
MTQSFDGAMQHFDPVLPLGVALSGGADSTALLVAAAARWPGQVVALHVNHGLQAAAADFEAHCQAVCQQLGVPLRVQRVQAHPVKGQSPEDAARLARYRALQQLAQAHEGYSAVAAIALAQHADDQVETLLLALSRGSGLAGISGMAPYWQREGVHYYRPLLHVAGAELRRWLAHQRMQWIEDPTNTHEQFTRNRIRAQILPVLQATFPAFRTTFARSAAHAAQAQTLLDEVAQSDLQCVCKDGVQAPQIKALQALSDARRSNVLRYWLKHRFNVIPSEVQLLELLRQIAHCSTRGHKIHIKVGHGMVTRTAGALTWYNPALFNSTCL